jgi:threonine dehydratase
MAMLWELHVVEILNLGKVCWFQVFSFKLRGAYNMMAKLPPEQLKKGVICSSAGNHAQGVALAARKLNCDAVIAMPVTTPEIKVSVTEALFFL